MSIIPTITIENSQRSPKLKLPKLNFGDSYRFHTMVKPSGSQCNLDCTYCFYLHKEDLLQQPKRPRMSKSLLELHIKQYIEAQSGPSVEFTWQGGEPTLMGIDFFKQVIAIQNKYKKANQSIFNDIQTNGTLLDDKWCRFIKEHQFLVGLSIDGPALLHDQYRYSKTKKPTFKRVMRAVELLHKHGITFNALCVVNNSNAQQPLEVYRFIRDHVKPQIIQFIPAVDPTEAPLEPALNLESPSIDSPIKGEHSAVTDWSVGAKDWGIFLSTIWHEWYQHDFGHVFVDQFENIISMMFGHGAQKCVNSQICGKALAIEHNGDVFSCDHFVYPQYKLGNITKIHQGDLAFSDVQKKFGYAKSNNLPNYCKSCSFLSVCWGECPKNRIIASPTGEPGLNYLCQGLKIFYATAFNARPNLAKKLNI